MKCFYNNDLTCRFICLVSILFTIFYSTLLFVLYRAYLLFSLHLDAYFFLVPFGIISFFLVFLTVFFYVSEAIYCVIYYIFGLFLGYLLYIFQVSVVVRIVMIFIDIPVYIGAPGLYLIPFFICLYGTINALITKVDKITLKFNGFKDQVKILHLSDIHLGAIHQKSSCEKIVDEIMDLSPDIVVITGDMADGSLKVKDEWMKPFDAFNGPILYVSGNHEPSNPKRQFLNSLKSTFIKHIGNNEVFKFKGINFLGVDFEHDLLGVLSNIKNELPNNTPNILLSHVPCLRPEELADFNIFLFLAGHTHGGQLFPFHILVYCLNACFSGLYSDKTNSHFVYVSEGVNNAVVPMRVGSRRIFAEITITG